MSFVAVAPFLRAKVAPFLRAKDKPQTGTIKLFDKALCKLAGMKDTALSAYLHRKATAWYKRFPPMSPIHSPDRAKDPKTPQVDGGDGAGGSPEEEEERLRPYLRRPDHLGGEAAPPPPVVGADGRPEHEVQELLKFKMRCQAGDGPTCWCAGRGTTRRATHGSRSTT